VDFPLLDELAAAHISGTRNRQLGQVELQASKQISQLLMLGINSKI